MSGQFKTVALQTVGVAVIAAIVFVVFIRSDEPRGLSGIEAGGRQDRSAADPKSTADPRNERGNRPGADNSRPGGPTQPERMRRTDDRPSFEVDPGSEGVDEPDPGPSKSSPPIDQYDDFVGRLMEQVGLPALYERLDPPARSRPKARQP